jgi:hypothetical protein
MAGKIFYRERVKSKDGSKSPRYRIIAVSDINLKVYADHFRKTELDQIAAATGAELIVMERGEKHR